MFRRTALLTALLIAVLAVPAWAQRGRPQGPGGPGFGFFGGPGGGGRLFLIANPAVQEELKLTEEQKQLLQDLRNDLRQKMASLREIEDRQQRFQRMREITQEAQELLDAILEPNQKTRLEQIELQLQGPRALLRRDVAEKLGLTEEQRSKIREIFESLRPDFSRIREMSPEERRQFFQSMRERAEKAQQEALAVLTPEQKEKWEKMLGAPFDVSRLRPRFPGRRPGGPDGRPGGPGRRPQRDRDA